MNAASGLVVAASHAQQRLWFLHHAAADRNALTLSGGVRISGALDPADVAAAVRSAGTRHEVLRSAFRMLDGVLYQEITTAPPEVACVDVSADPARVEVLAAADAGEPFDLTRAPLIRFTLVRVGPEQHVLLVSAHHVITDAWSLELLTAEVAAGLRARREGHHLSATPPELQYADYAAWQDEQLASEEFAEQVSWWQHQLAGAPRLVLPPTRVPAGPSVVAGLSLVLDQGRTAALRAIAEGAGGSMSTTLLATFHATFARLTGQHDLVLGSTVAGRTNPDTETMLGLFANMVAVRLRIDGTVGFSQLAAQAARVCGQVYERQEVPFDLVVERVANKRARDGHPLFPVLVQAIPPAPRMAVPGLRIEPLPGQRRASDLDLLVTVTEALGELQVEVDYRADRHLRKAMTQLFDGWRELIDAVLDDPELPLDAITLTGAFDPAAPADSVEAPAGSVVTTRTSAVDSETAEALGLVWTDVLGTAPELDSNFFLAGGSSLQMMVLLSKVHARFGVDVPLEEFLTDPTPARLAQELSRSAGAQSAAKALEEVLADIERTSAVPVASRPRASPGAGDSMSTSGGPHV